MTPVILEVLLWYYYHTEPIEDTPAHDEAITYLKRAGLIDTTGEHRMYEVTERGRVFINMLLKTPLPRQQWVDPR